MPTPRDYATTLAPPVSPTPPASELLVDWWAGSRGVGLVSGAVDTWTGQKRGLVRTAPGGSNRPTYAPAVMFRNKLALGYAQTNSLQLRLDAASPDIVAAGSRPYTIHLWHWIGSPKVAIAAIFRLGNVAAGGANAFGHYVAVTNDAITCSYNGATAGASISGVGTKMHCTEFWADGTLLNTRDNENLQTVSFTGSLNAAGVTIRDNDQGGDKNQVFDAVFSAKPSDAYIATLKNWMRDRFGGWA